MNSTVWNLIFELIIIPLLGILVGFLVKYLKIKSNDICAKIENDNVQKYLNMLNNTISQCVIATNQTYVEALKKEGKFDLEAQKIAFDKTKTSVLQLLSQEAKVYLTTAIGDLDSYINNTIEAEVNLNK